MKKSDSFFDLLMRDKRFKMESYRFVYDAIEYAQKTLHMGQMSPSEGDTPESRVDSSHVTGQDLCRAIKEYALEQYGYLARPVLHELGINRTDDVGEIVYNLIGIGKMFKTPEDRQEDFENVFNLADELEKGFTFKN